MRAARLSPLLLCAALSLGAQTATHVFSPADADSTLDVAAKREPDSLRVAITTTRTAATRATTDSGRALALSFASQLASSYSRVWNDSFFVRQVAHFAESKPDWRKRWVIADSTRRAGIVAVAHEGTPTAMRLWRRSALAFRALHDTAGLAAATGNIGAGFYLAGDLDSAAVYLERARKLALSARDRRTEANAVGTLASVHKDRGELRQAHALYEQALALRQGSGDGRGAAADHNNLGLIAQSLGALDEARADFLAALADNRAAGRRHSEALNLANLATLASLIGDSPRADSLYRLALGIHEALGELDDEAVVLHDIGLLQMRRADYDGALLSLRRALVLSDSTGAVLEHIAELADLASLQSARGDVEGGLSTLRRAEKSARTAKAPDDLSSRLAITHGELSVSLNALADAERDYARAERFAASAGDRGLQANVERGRGLLLVERRRFAEATVAFASSMRNHQAAGDIREAAASRIWLGYAQGQEDDTLHARRSITKAGAEMHAVGDAAGEAAALDALADLEEQYGARLAAETHYRKAIELLGSRRAPEVSWRLHAGLGATLRARGALPEASAELQLAVKDIERTAGGLRIAEQRESYRADKWDVYAMLAFNEQQRGRVNDAFAASERLRARQALDLLDRGSVRFASRDDAEAMREQGLRHRIGELTQLVAGDEGTSETLRGERDDRPARDAARDALSDLEREYDALQLERRQTDPASVRLADESPVSAHDVQAQLHPDELLLEYLITDSAATLFVLSSDSAVAIPLEVRRHELASLIDYSRDAIAHPSTSGPAAWRAPLRRLYRLLVQPVADAGLLRSKKRLIIVPHAELHFLPFGALMLPGAGDHYLIEQASIVTAPSASLWLRLSQRPPLASARGVLALAPRADALPASRREVEAIGAIYGRSATVLRGAVATRDAFVTRAPSMGIVHLASLGVLNKHNPLFSFVELSPSGSDDGRLAVTDVLGLHLDASLVTLSACQTALGAGALADVPAGDDWVGFTSAFLRAGARDVLATLWPVEDDATATLMTSFYGAFSGGENAADALATAQRAAIRDPARAAPFRWAGFVVTGAR
jgi:CHAT domain-containing protein/tetratricopeptide (TPR) repeat protein